VPLLKAMPWHVHLTFLLSTDQNPQGPANIRKIVA
jgi:hypothetical protein